MTRTVANPLLAEALEAHGGLERWRRFAGMSSTIVTGGRLWDIKGVRIIPVPRRVTTDLRRQRTTVAPFGEPDWNMIWTPERVAIEDGAGRTVAERDDPRQAFAGHGRDTPWDPLHLAYFNGYAMWTYHALPFVLAEPGYEVRDIATVAHGGGALRGLAVRFPDGVHSHTREQRFYFGDDGLLARHDYTVDVWADTAAAHLVSDYVRLDGFLLPTRRRVHPRLADGSFDPAVEIVAIDLSDYVLSREAAPARTSAAAQKEAQG